MHLNLCAHVQKFSHSERKYLTFSLERLTSLKPDTLVSVLGGHLIKLLNFNLKQFYLLWCCFISSYETSPAYDLSNIQYKSVGAESTDMAGLTF